MHFRLFLRDSFSPRLFFFSSSSPLLTKHCKNYDFLFISSTLKTPGNVTDWWNDLSLVQMRWNYFARHRVGIACRRCSVAQFFIVSLFIFRFIIFRLVFFFCAVCRFFVGCPTKWRRAKKRKWEFHLVVEQSNENVTECENSIKTTI